MQQKFLKTNKNEDKLSPVLLVCIFNKMGRIITHDYLYQNFIEYGDIVKILIFQKAKVWKTFVQFRTVQQAQNAKKNLNNKVVFEDGSKMNIFHAKIRSIQFQNDNLGGVDYDSLHQTNSEKKDNSQQQLFMSCNSSGIKRQSEPQIRGRRSTVGTSNCYQKKYQQKSPSWQISNKLQWNYKYQQLINKNIKDSNEINSNQPNGRQSYQQQYDHFQKQCQLKIAGSSIKPKQQNTYHSLFCDADQLFRQIALESHQYKKFWEEKSDKTRNNTTIPLQDTPPTRKKSQSMTPSIHTQQFIQQNIPSSVLFVRSIPLAYTVNVLKNIFSNFGTVVRIIFIRSKLSALIEYYDINEAIQAKDQLNYSKCQLKVFYSHYQTLLNNNYLPGNQDYQDYNCTKLKSASLQDSSSHSKKTSFLNPPSQTLYLTQLIPANQVQIQQQCLALGCQIIKIDWKKQSNNNNNNYKNKYQSKQKWACLIQLKNINESLKVMGFLQGYHFQKYKNNKNNKQLKISFTRSKISSSNKFMDKEQQSKSYQKSQSKQQSTNNNYDFDIAIPITLEQNGNKIRNRWNTVSFKPILQKEQD